MRTGRLSISRGHQIVERRQPPRPVSFVPAGRQTGLDLIQVRINALERLTRLVEQGAISLDEFRIEKALVLHHSGGQPAQATPSLRRRPRRARYLLLAAAAGLGIYGWAQPAATAEFLTQAQRFIGG